MFLQHLNLTFTVLKLLHSHVK